LTDAKIMASGDLNEYRILELMASNAPIDVFGVGTDLATSSDLPSLGAVYKLVEMETASGKRYTAKFSQDKVTLPGAKQVFRYPDHDLVGCSWECPSCGPGGEQSEALLRPVILNGELVAPLPGASAARDRARERLRRLPAALRGLFEEHAHWKVEYSQELLALFERVRQTHV
jgi:nicotinate phosphoribosyltransferase